MTTELFSLSERNKSGKWDFQQKKTNECEVIHSTSVKALLSLTVHQQISTLAPIKKKDIYQCEILFFVNRIQ